VQSILHFGGRHAVAEQLGLRCKRRAPGAAAGSTAEELAQQLLQFMIEHPPEELLLLQQLGKDSSSRETSDHGGSNHDTASGSISSSQLRQATSSSSSSIGRSRLANVRLKRHRWGQLPTQRQLVAAGRPDLAAGLQKHGHDRVRGLLGLPEPKRKQLRKVGGWGVFAVVCVCGGGGCWMCACVASGEFVDG
jgi:hypothetical protein